jgi:hypothetical protein
MLLHESMYSFYAALAPYGHHAVGKHLKLLFLLID